MNWSFSTILIFWLFFIYEATSFGSHKYLNIGKKLSSKLHPFHGPRSTIFFPIYSSGFFEQSQGSFQNDPFYIKISNDNQDYVDVKVKITSLSKRKENIALSGTAGEIRIDLIPMLHIADKHFFTDIDIICTDYDQVLFELVTSRNNIFYDSLGRRKICCHLYPTQEQVVLAQEYDLCPQLEAFTYLDKRNWFLADLDKEKIALLQQERGEVPLGSNVFFSRFQELGQAFFQGRAPEGKILPRFFLPGRWWGLGLRALLWLTPCPEMQVMLLDWGRTYPRAGTISDVSSLVLDAAFFGNLKTAKKLAFAQMLVSSQSDGGSSWGQKTSVIIRERNSQVIKEVQRAIDEGSSKVAVLYGCLHMKDLQQRLEQAGFTQSKISWLVAWRIPMVSNDLYEQFGPVLKLGLVPLYIGIGSWDWIDTIRDAIQESIQGNSVATLGVIFFYLLRHLYLYFGLAKFLVSWEKKMF